MSLFRWQWILLGRGMEEVHSSFSSDVFFESKTACRDAAFKWKSEADEQGMDYCGNATYVLLIDEIKPAESHSLLHSLLQHAC